MKERWIHVGFNQNSKALRRDVSAAEPQHIKDPDVWNKLKKIQDICAFFISKYDKYVSNTGGFGVFVR